jgi:recombination protein RecT
MKKPTTPKKQFFFEWAIEETTMATQDLTAITKYLHQDSIKLRFSEVVGDRNVGPYLASVMLAVANDDTGKLALCKPASVYVSALRAASLRLSVDPSTGQAYLVPYKDKATLIVGYKGLYDMAVRTNKYRYINVVARYEGETTEADPISGLITLRGLGGKRVSDKVIGWMGAFEMLNGFAYTMYMTVEEIHDYAKTYSQSYAFSSSPWQSKKPRTVQEMEKKTVLRIMLRKHAYLDPADVSILEETEQDAAPFDVTPIDVGEPDPATPETEQPKDASVDIERPLVPETLRAWLAENVKEIGIYQHTPEQMGLMNGMLTQAFAPDKDAEKIRRSCLRYLWGVDSSKKLNGPQIKATLDWLKPVKDSGGAYAIDTMAAQELHAVWTAANVEAGQGTLI